MTIGGLSFVSVTIPSLEACSWSSMDTRQHPSHRRRRKICRVRTISIIFRFYIVKISCSLPWVRRSGLRSFRFLATQKLLLWLCRLCQALAQTCVSNIRSGPTPAHLDTASAVHLADRQRHEARSAVGVPGRSLNSFLPVGVFFRVGSGPVSATNHVVLVLLDNRS